MSPIHNLPQHVAIIMDGNGRWAEASGLSRVEGHAEGARAVRETVRECRRVGVRYLTLYAFSVANWGRPQGEVQALMGLLLDFAESEKEELRQQGVRLEVVGDAEELPLRTRQALDRARNCTATGQEMTLSLALSYGGRADLVNAARALAVQVQRGELLPEEVTEEALSAHLSTGRLPAVDLLIRTGGEQRMSDFLLFEAAYAELCFLPIMWPDFGPEALQQALQHYGKRERRFGLTGAQTRSQPESVHASPSEAATARGQSFDPLDATLQASM